MQYLNGDLARLQVEQDDIKRKQQLGQTLQQAGLNPVQGGNSVLALLAALTSTIRGNSLMKDASKSMSENLASQFDAQNQADQAKAEAEQKRREEDWQRRLQEIDYGNKSAAQYRAPSNIDPLSPEGMAAQAQLKKMTAGPGPGPSESDRKIEQLRQLGATDDQIRSMLLGNQVGAAPAGYRPTANGALEAIPGGPADKSQEKDPKAAAAAQARELLGKLQAGLAGGNVSTGPIDQFLPSKPNQEFISTAAQLTQPFQALTRIPGNGNQSDADLKALMAGLPTLDKYETVNKASIESLMSYINKLSPPEQAAALQQVQQAQQPQQPAQGGWSIQRLD